MRKILLSVFSLCLCATASAQDEKDYSEYVSAVDEFVPAPGQFTNFLPKYEAGDDAASMLEKCSQRVVGAYENRKSVISLGSWGGYVTFHFDHPIVNVSGENDFFVQGNALDTWSEPGIVMVSEDGEQWYELSGSADTDSLGSVIYDYEITYEREGDLKDVKWTDNKGGSGYVYRNDFHTQEYFPQWIDSPLTFKGTRLPDNAYDSNAGMDNLPQNWIAMQLRYGYADNFPNIDEEGNSFNIDWAVDENRNPVKLAAIQYVRIYTSVNQSVGWVGEVSTEIGGAKDLHLSESVEHLALKNITLLPAVETERYNAYGVRLSAPEKGMNVVVYSDGSVRKINVK